MFFLQYKEGNCFNNSKFIEKTEYRLKNYFKKLNNILENNDLKEFFEEIKKRALYLENKKKIYMKWI